MPLSLASSPQTLKMLMAALSQQTGLAIDSPAFLQERRLTVVAAPASTPARSLLDGLAEMYDWRWFADRPGHYLLTRKRLPPSDTVVNAAYAVTQALPADVRKFLGSSLPLLEDSYSRSERELSPLLAQAQRHRQIAQKLRDVVAKEPDLLFATFKPLLFVDDQPTDRLLYFRDMTPEQQEKLILTLTLEAWKAGHSLLQGELTSYERDPLNACIMISNNMMSVEGYGLNAGGVATSIRSE